jgi:ATP-binding cassette subfamily C (CFTR/MRP) protein 1
MDNSLATAASFAQISSSQRETNEEEVLNEVIQLDSTTDLAHDALGEIAEEALEQQHSYISFVPDGIKVIEGTEETIGEVATGTQLHDVSGIKAKEDTTGTDTCFSKQQSPETNANILSKLTFWWLNPLTWLAWKRPLQMDDLWQLSPENDPNVIQIKFGHYWDREVDLFNAIQLNSLEKEGKSPIRVRHVSKINQDSLKSTSVGSISNIGTLESGLDAGIGRAPSQPALGRATSQYGMPIFVTGSRDDLQARIIKGEKPSLVRALFKSNWQSWTVSGMCDLVSDVVQLASPMVMKALISSLETPNLNDPYPVGFGYGMAVLMFVLQLLNIFFTAHYWQAGQKTGFRVRSAIVSTIYNKTLLLNASSRLDFNTGKVVNIMGTDAARIDGMSWSIHDLWSSPLVIIVATALLVINLGPSALVGVAFLIVMFPIQGFITKRLMALRKKVNVFTDRRVKVTGEIISGIRAIKFQGWEAAFMSRLTGGTVNVKDFPKDLAANNPSIVEGDNDWEGVRAKELKHVRELMITRAFMLAVVQIQPVFGAMLSFLTYSWLGNTLTPAIVFSSIALFNTMRQPLMTLPRVANALADALVSIKRVESLLFAPEIAGAQFLAKSSGNSVELTAASFQWDSPPEVPASKPKHPNKILQFLGLDGGKSSGTVTGATMKGGTGKSFASSAQKANKSVPELEITTPVKIDNAPVKIDHVPVGDTVPNDQTSIATLGRSVPVGGMRGQLNNVNLRIPQGKFVCVIGPVGSGKSSLLSAIVGEMSQIPTQGFDSVPKDVRIVRGRVAYCPQMAWIQNATVRDNIVFGKPFDAKFYRRVLRASALEHDLTILPRGDATEIGERGINISGGQKARISLARCVFAKADVVVLDDPLAAVDAHVASHIVKQCLLGDLLNGTTRILATHRLDVLKHADWIVSVIDGKIVEQGTLDDLLKTDGYCAAMAGEFGLGGHGLHQEDERDVELVEDVLVEKTRETLSWKDGKKKAKQGDSGKLMSVEEREVGAVKLGVYKDYFNAAGGILGLIVLVLLLVAMQGASVAVNVWLGIWSSYALGAGDLLYELVYVALGVLQALLALCVGIVIAIVGLKASKHIHDAALWSVLRSPTSFFDTNPVGRILSRFTRDIDSLDNSLPMAVQMSLNAVFSVVASFVTICVVFPWFILAIVATMPLYYFIQAFYRRTSRELKRLDSISRSPLYAHFSETLTGLSTIRAFGVTDQFSRTNIEKLDENGRAYYLMQMVTRWNALRLGIVSSLLVLCASMFCVGVNSALPAGIVGLVLTYAVSVSQSLNMAVRTSADTEVQFNSVERLLYYANSLEAEAPLQGTVPNGWIWRGGIEVKDIQLRYRPGLPLVLKGLSLSIRGGQRVAIVGRTGSGKSSLLQAMFRLVELEEGSIEIDGVDAKRVGLFDLRDRLSIVTQDAALYSGTVRSNLDPFGNYDDLSLWRALDSCGDLAKFLKNDQGLDYPVAENGENFSVGQRQLLCLARALLRGAKIVCLDEASASVDLATDAFIQRTLREDPAFKDKTIVTIAHRLETVMDYDLICVLVDGQVGELGSPQELMQKGGLFASMVNESSGMMS